MVFFFSRKTRFICKYKILLLSIINIFFFLFFCFRRVKLITPFTRHAHSPPLTVGNPYTLCPSDEYIT